MAGWDRTHRHRLSFPGVSMQIQSDQSIAAHGRAIHHASSSTTSRAGSTSALASRAPAVSLIPPHSGGHSLSPSNASRPAFQEGRACEPMLPQALQEALRNDHWDACTAALTALPGAAIEDHVLMQHAARLGAEKVVFRLQGKNVSPFVPDMQSGAFYLALTLGNERLAGQMLDTCRVSERVLPDLKPCLEAAVDHRDHGAIAWLVKFSVKNRSDMPFALLSDAIGESNARRVEIMISHPAFAAAMNDPKAECLFLAHAIRKGTAEVLSLLLSRKRSAANAAGLWEKIGRKGNTLLHLAAASGDLAKLKCILDMHPDIRREGASDSFFARLLRGDAIDAKNNDGKTAWTLAVEAGHEELATMLIERDARS